jgi:benzylsuccinate CoA-transferase BbsE subunit
MAPDVTIPAAAQGDGAGGERPRPLSGIRVVDLAGPFGAYASRLLADLGATVIRVVPPSGDPLANEWPVVQTPSGEHSAFAWFVNVDKQLVALDPGDATGAARLEQLLSEADVLVESWGNDETAWARHDRAELARRYPRLTVVSVTPFGINGPRSGDSATDLVALASGGLLSLGGYPDREPIATPGQARLAASIFGAAAAIFGLIGREKDGRGRQLDVAAQEVIAAALEDAIPQFDLTGTVRGRAGDTPREAGTGIYRCADGYVSMVAGRLGTAKAWRSLVAWLVEEAVPGAEALQEAEWDSFAHRQRPESVKTFMAIFDRFTSRHTKAELYEQAQRRDIALAPVNEIPEVLADSQLLAREFFVPLDVPELDREVRLPGRPYRLTDDVPFEPYLEPSMPTAEEAGDSDALKNRERLERSLTGVPARP